MARAESRTKVGIWTDADFLGLGRDAQRAYWMVYSQPTILLCGVVALTLGRWARYSRDGTEADLRAALEELSDSGFLVIDWDTEEILVRSFMRNDGVWRSPKTRGAARDCVKTVLSKDLRQAIGAEMRRLVEENPATADTQPNGVSDTACDGASDRTRAHAHAVSSLPSPVSSRERSGSASLAPFESEFDEAVWPAYPVKADRAKALRAYAARRRAGATRAELLLAVQNYSKRTGADLKFTKHAATFFGPDEPWKEWLDGPADTVEGVAPYDHGKQWVG